MDRLFYSRWWCKQQSVLHNQHLGEKVPQRDDLRLARHFSCQQRPINIRYEITTANNKLLELLKSIDRAPSKRIFVELMLAQLLHNPLPQSIQPSLSCDIHWTSVSRTTRTERSGTEVSVDQDLV